MRILIIMGGFFPGRKYGGPPVSISNLSILLPDHQFYIITKNHDLGEKRSYKSIKDGWNSYRHNVEVLYLSDKEYTYSSFKRIIEQLKPDSLYLQGLFQQCVFPALFLAKQKSIPVLLAPRGELCREHITKPYKKIPYILLLRILGLLKDINFQSTSLEETAGIIRILKVRPERIHNLNNIPSLPDKVSKQSIEKNKGSLRIVFFSRIVSKKNLAFALSLLPSIKGDITFDIIGPIEDEVYWQDCLKLISDLPSNIKTTYKGIIDHNSIHSVLSNYHLFFFPTYGENFGHVIAEALFAGCLPLISDQTPWTDINDFNVGWSFPLQKKQLWINALNQAVNLNTDNLYEYKTRIKDYLNRKFDIDLLRKQYINVFSLVSKMS